MLYNNKEGDGSHFIIIMGMRGLNNERWLENIEDAIRGEGYEMTLAPPG